MTLPRQCEEARVAHREGFESNGEGLAGQKIGENVHPAMLEKGHELEDQLQKSWGSVAGNSRPRFF